SPRRGLADLPFGGFENPETRQLRHGPRRSFCAPGLGASHHQGDTTMKRFLKHLFGQKTRTIRNHKPARVRLGMEALEERTLMAAALTASFDYADRVLRIEGTEQADQIQIVNNGGQVSVKGLSIRSTNSGPVWTNVPSLAAADIGYVEVR